MKTVNSDTIFLNEYGEAKNLNWSQQQVLLFEAFLEEVWENRKQSGILSEWYTAEEEPVNQPLLQIKHKRVGKEALKFEVKAANYIGIIRFNGTTIHVLPKIFGDANEEILKQSNAHLLWWLSYSKKLALPKHLTSLSYQKANFLEILIHLFASYTIDQLRKGVYQTYQEIESETSYMKGQLIFNEYVTNYLGRANFQKMYCRYDSFEIDNQFNRIIKYVCKWLRSETEVKDTMRLLDDIIWTLDEVSDVHVNHVHCDEVVLNRMFSDYQLILDYCRMFLSNSQSTTSDKNSDAFAFLVPMEKVFEEFILGFIDREVDEIEVSAKFQKKYLTEGRDVALNPDYHLSVKDDSGSTTEFLADAKYKLVYEGFSGVSRSDLYQMTAYAIRYRANQIHVFYPKWSGIKDGFKQVLIRDEFAAENEKIRIDLHALEICRTDIPKDSNDSIGELFREVSERLVERITTICGTETNLESDQAADSGIESIADSH